MGLPGPSGELLLWIILAGLGLGILAPFAIRQFGPRAFLGLAVYPAITFAFLVTTPTATFTLPWIPDLGVNLAFRLDGLGRAFGLLITGLGTLILIYASAYFTPKPNLGRFAGAFVAFLAAMLGIVLADDVISLFVFWELTSITSFLLIGFYHKEAESRTSATQALLLTGAGGLAMLAGFVWLGMQTGTYRISEMGVSSTIPNLTPAFGLIVLGCVTKSAQFPFHFWLPNAMAAPTPVSAFLHSATMVKAGIFLLARMEPVLSQEPAWVSTLTTFGALTVMAGVVLSLWQSDLKKLLAYSTVSTLGMLLFLLGTPGVTAQKAFVALLVAHALYKGAYFLIAGSIDHETGTRDTTQVHGLARIMPMTATTAALVSLSSLGLVGTLGFLGKEYAILASSNALGWIVVTIFAVGTGFVNTRIGLAPFFFGRQPSHPSAHEAPLAMTVGPLLLGIGGVVTGLLAATFGPAILTPMAGLDNQKWVTFPGFEPAFFAGLLFSGIAIAIGFQFRPLANPPRVSLDQAWRTTIVAIPDRFATVTSWVQTGRLRDGLAVIFALISVAAWSAMARTGFPAVNFGSDLPQPHEWAIVLMSIIAAFGVLVARRRMTAICMLGIAGTGVAVLFLTFGAPDLAVTQILTDLLTIVIAVLVFHRLPRLRRISAAWTRYRDITIAGAFGITMAYLALVTENIAPETASARFYAEQAVPGAYGRNVVNTILVDFRAMDTLGEIVVVALAALGVFAMMRLRVPKGSDA